MPEVETTDGAESPDASTDETVETPEATPVPGSDSTWKARLAGKDRALSAAKKEADEKTALLTELQRWKAEKEAADMTEVEKLQKQVADLEAARADAVRQVKKAQLERDFPLAFALLGEVAPLDNEGKLAEIEAMLKAKSEPAEPDVNPNNPARISGTNKAAGDKTEAELLEDIKNAGPGLSESFRPSRVLSRVWDQPR